MKLISKKNGIIVEYNNRKTKYSHLCETIERIVTELLVSNGIEYYTVTSRVKELESLKKKIDKKGDTYNTIDEITDIAGIRIITYYSEDVDKVANIINKEFKIDINNSIDKRTLLEPDKFGYMSIHFIAELSNKRLSLTEYSQYKDLKFEIQIRSILQHTWAEIEHDLGYKSAIEIPKDIRRNFFQVASILEVADDKFNEIRKKLSDYSAEVKYNLAQKGYNYQNILLDSISLTTFLNNDPEIKLLNEEIANIAGVKLVELHQEYSRTLNKLKWLDINNIDELKAMLSNNKKFAISIARKLFSETPPSDNNVVDIDIGVFYLCYAEMLRKSNDIENVIKYVKDNNLGTLGNPAEFARILWEVYQDILEK